MLRWIVGAVALIAACGGGDGSNGGSEAPLTVRGMEYSVPEFRDLIRNEITEDGWERVCAEFLEMAPATRAELRAEMVAGAVVPDEETAIRFVALSEEVCNDERP